MTYEEVLERAREALAPKCKVCPDCNGIACKGQIPGVGAKGSGRAFTVCREFLSGVKLRMDAVHEAYEPDLSIELFGKTFAAPFFIAPIGGMSFNYTNVLTEAEYAETVIGGAREKGIFAFTGDGPDDAYFPATVPLIQAADGVAVSTIKPWKNEKIIRQIHELENVGAMAFAVDVDAAALINLKLQGKPVDPKSQEELRGLVESTSLPFIVKGVMTGASAVRCADAGVYGIVVSNHGGRVLDDTPAPCSMLPEIRAAVGDRMKIFVDGGIRSGADVFKCLALGADAVLIGRPYAIAAHGGGREGVGLYTDKIRGELAETMIMTDCRRLSDIGEDKIVF